MFPKTALLRSKQKTVVPHAVPRLETHFWHHRLSNGSGKEEETWGAWSKLMECSYEKGSSSGVYELVFLKFWPHVVLEQSS